MKEKLILAYGRSEQEVHDFIEFLKKHFQSVICTGISYNNREPFKEGYRGYITITGDPEEDFEDE